MPREIIYVKVNGIIIYIFLSHMEIPQYFYKQKVRNFTKMKKGVVTDALFH